VNSLKKNLVPLLGIALVVAVLATGVFYGIFVAKLREVPKDGPSVPVVVAARALSKGVSLKADDLRVIPWPEKAVLKGAFRDIDPLEGAVLLDALEENEPVLKNRVARSDGKTAGAAGVPVGMRAVSARIAEAEGITDLLQAGHHVDVQVISLPGAPPELRTILQDVVVLRVETPKDQRGTPVVTLLVKPEEADALSLADASARVRLTLRNPLDHQTAPSQRVTLSPLFQTGLAAKPQVR
jgi:pilus assembly protein CpaB